MQFGRANSRNAKFCGPGETICAKKPRARGERGGERDRDGKFASYEYSARLSDVIGEPTRDITSAWLRALALRVPSLREKGATTGGADTKHDLCPKVSRRAMWNSIQGEGKVGNHVTILE